MSENNKDDDFSDYKELPANELDFQNSLIEPGVQRPKKGLRNKLKVIKGIKQIALADDNGQLQKDKDGNPIVVEETEYNELAGFLQIWVKDFRLGNLSQTNGEYEYVIDRVNLAADLLTEEMPRASLAALNAAMSRLEVSNSKGAKLRELIQTLRKVTRTESDEGKKPSAADVRNYR